MARSPIEMMVDKACGFDPDAPRPEPVTRRDVDSDTLALMNVGSAAVAWLKERENGNYASERDAFLVLIEASKVLAATGW